MKLRNIAKKFASGLLITTMTLSLVACGAKDSSDNNDKKKDKKEASNVEITVDELISDMNTKTSVISTEDIESILEDECVTYEEFEDLLKKLPSYKAEGSVDLGFDIEGETEGTKESESLDFDCTFLMEYDNENMGIHYNIEMKYVIEEESDSFEMDYWIINEDGTYYAYVSDSYSEIAQRTELGNIKDVFGEDGISKEDLEAAIDAAEIPEDYLEMFAYAEDITDSEMMNQFKSIFSVAKEYAKYAGKEYYNLIMNFDAIEIIKTFKESDEVKALLEEYGVDNIDDLLTIEISDGLTIKDFLDITKFDINYYIDPTDLFVAHIQCDFKDLLNSGCDILEKFMNAEYEDEDVTFNIDCTSASFAYDFDKDADVTVEFDGEYEDIDLYDDYDQTVMDAIEDLE